MAQRVTCRPTTQAQHSHWDTHRLHPSHCLSCIGPGIGMQVNKPGSPRREAQRLPLKMLCVWSRVGRGQPPLSAQPEWASQVMRLETGMITAAVTPGQTALALIDAELALVASGGVPGVKTRWCLCQARLL